MPLLDDALELPAGRLVALDLGKARHGVAACDEAGFLSSPVKTLPRAVTRAQDFAAIAAIVAAERAVGVLIGLPASDSGTQGEQARWVRRYAGRLAGALPVPVALWDETLSTVDAQHLLAEGRRSPAGGRSRTGIDAAAAALILQSFLDARRLRALPDGMTHPVTEES